MKLLRGLSGGLLFLAVAASNSQAGSKKDDTPPLLPVVPVSKPVQRAVTDYAHYTGRTNAKEFVIIQPRVTGFLVKVAFKEGAEISRGDVLFEIDPRPYEAQVMAARARLTQAEAGLRYAKATYARSQAIAKMQPNAVSPRELEQHQAQEDQARAALELDKANLTVAQINLDWTVIRAPIAGHVGRAQLTTGNLVTQDKTKLTTVVSMDPMHVYFDMDEPTLLRIRRAINEGKAKPGADAPVLMCLPGEGDFSHRGAIEFIDNQAHPKKGGVSVRGVFANPKPKDGVHLMLPGMAVRVRVPISQPYQALLVIDLAVITDQGLRYVYVVNSDNKVVVRRVTLGPLQDDGLRVVTEGLKKDDRVVVGGLQKVRPHMSVAPDLLTMPSLK